MTTKPKVFKVGDKVTWRVDEECPYRCPKCSDNPHGHEHMLSIEGHIRSISYADSIYCNPCLREGRGYPALLGTEGHIYFFRPDAGYGVERGKGAWFTADELQLIEGE